MKKKSDSLKIIIAVIVLAVVGSGVYAFIPKEPEQKSYPGVKRYIYLNDEYIDLKKDGEFEKVKEFLNRMNQELSEYMKEREIESESYVANGSIALVGGGVYDTYSGEDNLLKYTFHHTNPAEIKLLEEKIESYPEVEEIRENERPVPYKPDINPKPEQ